MWTLNDNVITSSSYAALDESRRREIALAGWDLVVIDEAQAIQDDRIFEELRLLLNLQLNERFLLTLVILGQPEIQDRLSAFPQFSQRIAIRAHLLPLNGDETLGYIQHRLKIGGCQRPIFTKEAMLRIFWYTNGIARKINTSVIFPC
ncbi:MAG: AAA family ATPase [Nitrospinae bacterium]|nr:AAA family ATPase [Nitrospinota bacterium]